MLGTGRVWRWGLEVAVLVVTDGRRVGSVGIV